MGTKTVFTAALLIDGTGKPRFKAELGIRDGRIAALSTGEALTGRQKLDATDLIVVPGFIDFHSHSDWILPLEDHDVGKIVDER